MISVSRESLNLSDLELLPRILGSGSAAVDVLSRLQMYRHIRHPNLGNPF